jgi:recombinational DNA repair protein RecR
MDLEFVDGNTLKEALEHRRNIRPISTTEL